LVLNPPKLPKTKNWPQILNLSKIWRASRKLQPTKNTGKLAQT